MKRAKKPPAPRKIGGGTRVVHQDSLLTVVEGPPITVAEIKAIVAQVAPHDLREPVRRAIGIFLLTKEWTTYAWLCAPCADLRRRNSWTLEHVCWRHYECPGGYGDVACQNCDLRAQTARQVFGQ